MKRVDDARGGTDAYTCTEGVRVLEPGLLTTLQDLGRIGHQHEGMVVAGAMDTFSLQMANLLVGNVRTEACLEITLTGPRLEFLADTVLAITGAEMSPKLDGVLVAGWQALRARAGSVLEFGRLRSGCRAYLAVAGGWALEPVLGSKSTFLRGQVGGFRGRALAKGDVLPIYKGAIDEVRQMWKIRQPHYPTQTTLRTIIGPQAEMFTDAGRATFYTSEYTIAPASDRMGYRLQGPAIERRMGSDIISDSIPFGGIQVPADGMPIILLADRQTTGGYAKIATVIGVDLPMLAQLKPGNLVRFQEVSIEEAQRLYREREAFLEKFATCRRKVITAKQANSC